MSKNGSHNGERKVVVVSGNGHASAYVVQWSETRQEWHSVGRNN